MAPFNYNYFQQRGNGGIFGSPYKGYQGTFNETPEDPFALPPGSFNEPVEIGGLPISKEGIFKTSPLNPPSTTPAKSTTPELDAYKAYLSAQPDRRDHQLNKWGKALAIAAGAAEGAATRSPSAGISTSLGLIERPYRTALEEWQAKGGRLKEKAGIEISEAAINREVLKAERDYGIEAAKELRQSYETASKIATDEAQRQKIFHEIETGQYNYFTAPDGKHYKTNKSNGKTEAVAIVGESQEQQRKGKTAEDIKVEGVRQQGRIQIAGINASNARILESFKQLGDENLKRLESELARTNLTPLQQNQAMDGALEEIKLMYPQLINKIFDVDATTGEVKGMKAEPEAGAHEIFTRVLEDTVKKRSGQPTSAQKPELGMGTSTRAIPETTEETTAPSVPSTTPSAPGAVPDTSEFSPQERAAAVARIQASPIFREHPEVAQDEEAIAETIKEMREEGGSSAAPAIVPQTVPQVALPPPQRIPPVTIPQGIAPRFKPIPSIIPRRRGGSSGSF